MNFTDLKNEYTNLLETIEVRPEWKDAIDRKARGIYANKARYEEVSSETGVPWEVIGIIHSLECNLDFGQALHNGDAIIGTGKKTYRDPKRRGPFATWEEAALDALRYDGLDRIEDWSDEMVCYALEKYNGFGYRLRRTGVLSPYLWSGTKHYTIGKFVSDGKYVKTAKSAQIGAIPLYLRLKEIDIPKKEVVSQSSKLSLIKRIRDYFAGVSVAGIVAETMDMLNPVKEFIVENKYIFIGVTAAGTLYVLHKLLKKGISEYEQGRYIPSGQVKE